MLTAQIFSALTVSLCLLIDSIMIRRFLGEDAIAAYGMANPLLLAIGAIGTMLSAGVQVFCSNSLGRGSQEEANEGYSSAITATILISSLFVIAVISFRSFFARIMGAGISEHIFDQTKEYLAGFSIGAPGSMGALVLVPFLQIAGQSGLLIIAVLTMTVADIVLDLLNVMVFNGGMFGMGLASAISYYAAILVSAIYFLSPRSVFKFSLKQVKIKTIKALFGKGIPACFSMASSALLVFLMNRILTGINGSTAVAAFTVMMSIANTANCIATGIGGVSLTLSGILYHEEDRSGLKVLMMQLRRHSIYLGLGMGIILLIAAPILIALYIPDAGEGQDLAVLGLRLFALGFIPCCMNNAMKHAYQATEKTRLTEMISILEGAVFPALIAFVFSRFMNVTGAWLFFAGGEILTLLFIWILIYRKTGEIPWHGDFCLMLKKDFGAVKNETLEMQIHTIEEATAAAREAEQFCLKLGQTQRISTHIALCIEEMASNVVQYGFNKDSKNHHLSVRLIHKPDFWVLRFRDDCGAFDPVHFVPEKENQALGIRLVLGMADEASYTYSMNLNNLALKIPEK